MSKEDKGKGEENNKPMNDEEAENQVKRLIKFIKDSSNARIKEEATRANEESEEEKNKIISTQSKKLEKEFKKKEQQVLLKAKITNSNSLNEVRMKKLKAQQEIVQNAYNEARSKLVELTKKSDYPQLLLKLIVQALVHLEEKSVSLYCKKEDFDTVKGVLPKAIEEYKKNWMLNGEKECKVKVSTKRFIECSGGVLLSAKGGKIYCDNTLDVRLTHAYEASLPKLRSILFNHAQV